MRTHFPKPVVYISGPMTGLPEYNYTAFKEATELLEASGFIVLSPHTLPIGLDYDQYLDIALANIRACDQVYVLRGWSSSIGAKAEIAYAKAIGKEITGASRG